MDLKEIKGYAGYTALLTPMQAGKVKGQLDKKVRTEYGVTTYKTFIVYCLFDKFFIPVERKYRDDTIEYILADLLDTSGNGYRVNKTQYHFAEYLNQNFEDLESVLAYDVKEQVEKAEQKRLKAEQEEKAQQQKEANRIEAERYTALLKEKALRFVGTPIEDKKNEIFSKLHKDMSAVTIKNNIFPLMLAACIDDIDNERARNVLRLALHPSNKASTRFIEWYAGVKFPRKVKEREQFIMELSSEKINKQDIAPITDAGGTKC